MFLLSCALWLSATGAPPTLPLQQADAVRAAEIAFAQSMADRDLSAFAGCVAEDAVFFTGDAVQRGRAAIVERWRAWFEGESAPFSWQPELVEVLDSGGLALSSGPVLSADGTPIGSFNSIWRLDADGHWRVVFDKGCN